MDPQTFIKEIDGENYRRKKMNSLYNQYLKDVGCNCYIYLLCGRKIILENGVWGAVDDMVRVIRTQYRF
jgi:hypothetical protein